MVTNFHAPKSTLIMLVSSAHDLIMKAYKEAIKEKYKFLGYEMYVDIVIYMQC